MKFCDRERRIIELLQKQRIVRAEELSASLGVSLVTVRKDLQKMENEGRLVRTFGGAALTGKDEREMKRMAAMREIAVRVADEIQDGDSVILNAGNTTLFAARQLVAMQKRIHVITNSLSIAKELSGEKGIHLTLLGGEVTANAVFTHGEEAIGQLEEYRADKLVLSASGISCARGITTRHMEAAALFRKMIERAGEVTVVADETKIGFESFYYVSGLEAADCVVTNRCEDSECELAAMEERGIRIVRC